MSTIFMFDPAWDKGCSGCTGYVDSDAPSPLRLVSIQLRKRRPGNHHERRVPFAEQRQIAKRRVTPAEYNYRSKAEMTVAQGHAVQMEGEEHGLSVFFQFDDDVFHTYSTYARGNESLTDTYRLLDTTPYGRQQDFENSPPGWPRRSRPTQPPS